MRISYKHTYNLSKPCVAKVWFGEKYLIIKTPDIRISVKVLIDTFKESVSASGGVIESGTRQLRAAILKEETGNRKCVIEIVLSTSKGEELLAKEQSLLNEKDKTCLNRNKTPLRPQWIYDYISAPPPASVMFAVKGRHRAAPAVVKIWVHDKISSPRFYVWKCMDIQVFPGKFSESMVYNLNRYDKSHSSPLWPLVRFMKEHGIEHGHIEVVYKGDYSKSGIKYLLKVERQLVQKSQKSPDCLNSSAKQYMPQWITDALQ